MQTGQTRTGQVIVPIEGYIGICYPYPECLLAGIIPWFRRPANIKDVQAIISMTPHVVAHMYRTFIFA